MAASLRHMRNFHRTGCSLRFRIIKDAQSSRPVVRSYQVFGHPDHNSTHKFTRLLLSAHRPRKHNKCCRMWTVRFKSSTSELQYGGALQGGSYLPPPEPAETELGSPTAPLDTDLPVQETLNSLGEPTLASLGLADTSLAGFAHSAFKGFIQSGLEMIHVDLGAPWWSSIVIGVVIIRLCMLPVQIKTQRAQINMQNNMPTLQRLQQRMLNARQENDAEQVYKLTKELQDFKKRNKLSGLDLFMAPLVQLPVFLSVFVGLREMAYLPVESMKTGGILWFTDLTLADPYFILPLLTSATLLLTLEVGSLGSGMVTQQQRYIKMIMQGVLICGIPFIAQFPTALLCYWFSSNVFTLVQVVFMRIPAVQRFFKMPPRIQHTDMEKPLPLHTESFLDGYRKGMSNAKLVQEIAERERLAERISARNSEQRVKRTESESFPDQSRGKSDSEKDLTDSSERKNS